VTLGRCHALVRDGRVARVQQVDISVEIHRPPLLGGKQLVCETLTKDRQKYVGVDGNGDVRFGLGHGVHLDCERVQNGQVRRRRIQWFHRDGLSDFRAHAPPLEEVQGDVTRLDADVRRKGADGEDVTGDPHIPDRGVEDAGTDVHQIEGHHVALGCLAHAQGMHVVCMYERGVRPTGFPRIRVPNP
jgi:hypothetical protein